MVMGMVDMVGITQKARLVLSKVPIATAIIANVKRATFIAADTAKEAMVRFSQYYRI